LRVINHHHIAMKKESTFPSRECGDVSRECEDLSRECGMKDLLRMTNPNPDLVMNTANLNENKNGRVGYVLSLGSLNETIDQTLKTGIK